MEPCLIGNHTAIVLFIKEMFEKALKKYSIYYENKLNNISVYMEYDWMHIYKLHNNEQIIFEKTSTC